MDTLTPARIEELGSRLVTASQPATAQPGEDAKRQPVHTMYGGAHLFKADTAKKMGQLAIQALATYAPQPSHLASAIGLPAQFAEQVYACITEKLRREPVEDFRLDFEDGYGNRSAMEEDGHAQSSAAELAAGYLAGQLPPFVGIRIKSLSRETWRRSIRTLDLFVNAVVQRTRGVLPDNFVVTLPKLTAPAQAEVLAEVLSEIETRLGLGIGTTPIELMVETPQSIIDSEGRFNPRRLAEACGGRCRGVHFGAYDYTADLDITAAHQQLTHQSCDFARNVLAVSLAGSRLWISDSATNILPIPPHRGDSLTAGQVRENRLTVHRAWRLHYQHIRHSLSNGYYQGWDLHPAQLPIRYAAVFSFFLEGLEAAGQRLSGLAAKAAQASLVGEVFDDAATGQGLVNFFQRALNSGAIDENEAIARSGLSLAELRSPSWSSRSQTPVGYS